MTGPELVICGALIVLGIGLAFIGFVFLRAVWRTLRWLGRRIVSDVEKALQ